MAMVSRARIAGVIAACGLLLTTACGAGSTGAQVGDNTPLPGSAARAAGPEPFAQPVDIGGRSVYIDCRGTAAPGEPTVILVSGYHDSSDVWNSTDVLSLAAPAAGPPVQEALAQSHRVCSYDRPGTIRYVEATPLTDRNGPGPPTASSRWHPQPRTSSHRQRPLHPVLAARPDHLRNRAHPRSSPVTMRSLAPTALQRQPNAWPRPACAVRVQPQGLRGACRRRRDEDPHLPMGPSYIDAALATAIPGAAHPSINHGGV